MPALLPIILTVSHVLLAADTVPKFDVERTCRSSAEDFAGLDRAPSYVELLTCLEIAKQAAELPEESKAGTVGWR